MRGSYAEGDGSLSENLQALCVLENVRIDLKVAVGEKVRVGVLRRTDFMKIYREFHIVC